MQDIVFYAVANETLGLVRDYTNMRRADAPVLTIGVAVCLRMRLFADINVSTPYPIASFSGITDWRWSMDADFDRSTACKLVADEGGISVHTVTDTVNGETRSFTEIVIPISNMNTHELAAWLGNYGTKTGLTGELVGYDNNGNAIFVLQIENFTVRNRVAGLSNPTAVDEGIVTRSVAEQMIQTAVSSSAATKQDKLTTANGGMGISVTSTGIISVSDVPQSAVTGLVSDLASKQDKLNSSNGGTGISVTSTGIISVTDVPQSAVTGLFASLAGKQNALTFGWGLDHDYLDDVLSLARYRTVYSPTGATVTIVPGEAYKINATASAKTIEAASIPDNTWGLEGHLEIFVAGSGYVQTGESVFLANALKPDSVNNCTVRFHDGYAIISVEDHIAGYIVTVNATSGSGSLNYALGVSTEYIAVDASLNGQTLDLAGAVTNGEKHVVGNGYTETIVSGGINCTSKTTFSNLSMNGVIVSSGTLTMGDVYIPSGATVAVSGGRLAVEKVTGNGGVIELGSSHIYIPSTNSAIFSGCIIRGGHNADVGGAIEVRNGIISAIDCEFALNSTPGYGAALFISGGVSHKLEGCTFDSNTAFTSMNAGAFFNDCDVELSGCTFGELQGIGLRKAAVVKLGGTNNLYSIDPFNEENGSVFVSSGAIVNVATHLDPGAGVTFEEGGATIIPGGTASLAYALGGMTVPTIGNTNVVNLGGTFVNVSSGTAYASGCTFSGGSATGTGGGAFSVNNGSLTVSNSVISGCSGAAGKNGGGFAVNIGYAEFVSCAFNGNWSNNERGYNGGYVGTVGSAILDGCTFGTSQGVTAQGLLQLRGSNTVDMLAAAGSGAIVISGGAIIALSTFIAAYGSGTITVLDGGCTVNGNSIPAGTYTSIDSTGHAS